MSQTSAGPPSAAQREWADTSERHGPRFATDAAPPRLLLLGAVELSAVLSRAARTLGWRAFVIDPRGRFATPERFPDAEAVLVDWPGPAFATLGGLDGDCAVVALTHAPQLDDDGLRLALCSDAFYVGAMGSRRTQAARRERLTVAGLRAAEFDRLAGPAGLDLGGGTAAEAALAILAEAVAARHGRAGGPLRSSAHAIHPDARS